MLENQCSLPVLNHLVGFGRETHSAAAEGNHLSSLPAIESAPASYRKDSRALILVYHPIKERFLQTSICCGVASCGVIVCSKGLWDSRILGLRRRNCAKSTNMKILKTGNAISRLAIASKVEQKKVAIGHCGRKSMSYSATASAVRLVFPGRM